MEGLNRLAERKTIMLNSYKNNAMMQRKIVDYYDDVISMYDKK